MVLITHHFRDLSLFVGRRTGEKIVEPIIWPLRKLDGRGSFVTMFLISRYAFCQHLLKSKRSVLNTVSEIKN